MTTTYRWYTLAIPAGGTRNEYEFIGWSRTKEAAIAKRDKLPEAREAINIYAGNRTQAANDLAACYEGRRVRGWMSPEDRRVGRMIVKSAVMRAIFCPYTGVVLDMRRAVYIATPTNSFVCTGDHWDKVCEANGGIDNIRKMAGHAIDVYDGRELFR